MDHHEAIEIMEVAAAEPDGLDRLAAGDTIESAALAAHVAGCPVCMAELETLRALAVAVRDTLADEPAPELRERTLAHVAAAGRDRSSTAAGRDQSTPEGRERTVHGYRDESGPVADGASASRRSPSWAALAAAVVVAFVAGGLLVGLAQQRSLDGDANAAYTLAHVNEEALRIGAQPDAVRVALADPAGGSALGSLVFSSASGELAVMASGLPAPDAGWEYRCWLETDGVRLVIGAMTLGEGLAYWAGPSEGLDDATAGSVFGVSLVASDAAGGGAPVLLGEIDGGSS